MLSKTGCDCSYCTYISRRQEEHREFDSAINSIATLYTDLIGLSIKPGQDEAAWERITSGEAMRLLIKLSESLVETDKLLGCCEAVSKKRESCYERNSGIRAVRNREAAATTRKTADCH
jgi:hypothetical protein